MSNVLVVNITGSETRVALIESGVLAELYVERQSERSTVGNIYKGRVVRVLPGMQAAFVDIGTDRAAFLYVSDFLDEHFPFHLVDDELEGLDDLDADALDADPDESGALEAAVAPPNTVKRRRQRRLRIEDVLQPGQEVLVQAAKDPIGTKGARLTSHITLPGRHLVFMPTVDHLGISRRITSETERNRLRELVEEFRPEGSGFIVRTAAQHVPSEDLRRDMALLVELWATILEKRDASRAPTLLHADLDLIPRAARDLVGPDIARIIVDDTAEYERAVAFLGKYMPTAHCEVELYTGQEPIFDAFGIEIEINRALQRKVWLPSGAYLVIDETEALTAIDVNTGRYVGRTNLEDTITKINLEAVGEIVYQIRLRNIGGLIIIDFIDMESKENREQVFDTLAAALEYDKARTNLCKMSEFGLVEMTRKRVKENLVQQLCEPCPYCDGRGRVKSSTTVGYEILRELRRAVLQNGPVGLSLRAHPQVERFLTENERETLDWLEQRSVDRLELEASASVHCEQYHLATRPRR